MRISSGLAEIQMGALGNNKKVYLNPVYNETPVQKVKGLTPRKTPIEVPGFKPRQSNIQAKAGFAIGSDSMESNVYTFNGTQKSTERLASGLNFDSYA